MTSEWRSWQANSPREGPQPQDHVLTSTMAGETPHSDHGARDLLQVDHLNSPGRGMILAITLRGSTGHHTSQLLVVSDDQLWALHA
jgi:hypothetical protein